MKKDGLPEVSLTRDLLMLGMTSRGGYTRAQLEAIGEPWPPQKGWKSRCVGRKLERSKIEAFIGGARRERELRGRKTR
jgi:hypothetical protein